MTYPDKKVSRFVRGSCSISKSASPETSSSLVYFHLMHQMSTISTISLNFGRLFSLAASPREERAAPPLPSCLVVLSPTTLCECKFVSAIVHVCRKTRRKLRACDFYRFVFGFKAAWPSYFSRGGTLLTFFTFFCMSEPGGGI